MEKPTSKDESSKAQNRSLTAILGEELCISANRHAGDVVRAVDEIIPDFEQLRDCVVKLLKENEKFKYVSEENRELRAKEELLKAENKKMFAMINMLGDQKKLMLNDKAEIERLQREIVRSTEQQLSLQQLLEESVQEISDLQKKSCSDLQEAEKLQRIEMDKMTRKCEDEFEKRLREEKATFSKMISELQQKYEKELSQERASSFEKVSSLNMLHNHQLASTEANCNQAIFESNKKSTDAEARSMHLEKLNSELSSTIEIMRKDLTRFQDAQRNAQHKIFPAGSQMKAGMNSTLASEGTVSTLRTSAATEAAIHRRRVQVTEENSDSDLDDKKGTNSKRKKTNQEPRKRSSASGKRQPQPLDFSDPYAYV